MNLHCGCVNVSTLIKKKFEFQNTQGPINVTRQYNIERATLAI